jgi:hypothetical protein
VSDDLLVRLARRLLESFVVASLNLHCSSDDHIVFDCAIDSSSKLAVTAIWKSINELRGTSAPRCKTHPSQLRPDVHLPGRGEADGSELSATVSFEVAEGHLLDLDLVGERDEESVRFLLEFGDMATCVE